MGQILSDAKAVIKSGTALSNAINVGTKVLCGIQMPAAWDAANLTFQVSYDSGVTWQDLYDGLGTEIAVTSPAAGKYLAVDPSDYAGIVFLKVRSGTTGTPVNQTADRTIVLVSRKFYPIG